MRPSRRSTATTVAGLVAITIASSTCNPFALAPIENRIDFPARLDAFALLAEPPGQLRPAAGVVEFSLATPLFTDHAHKQRLMRLPVGTTLQRRGDGLPTFPDGTVLAKTFFYPRDARVDAEAPGNRQLVETRLLVKAEGGWSAATYRWTEAQDAALLLERGAVVPITWVDASGTPRSLRYEVPSRDDCGACHREGSRLVPLGPALRNLDHVVRRDSASVRQLRYLEARGVLSSGTAGATRAMPAWDDPEAPLEARARAYLEVNCAHCHREGGWASATGLRLAWELPHRATRIDERRAEIERRLTSRNRGERMPRLGTTIPHDEGIALLRAFLRER